MRYISKPSECEANLFEHRAEAPIGVRTREDGTCYVVTAQGQMVNVLPGEYIILEKPDDGTLAYPCKAEVFERRWKLKGPDFTLNNKEVEGTCESLELCAKMFDTYAEDMFPANEKGQVHMARVMMESVALEIRAYLAKNPR